METATLEKTKKRRKHRYLFQDTQGRWWVDYRTPEKRRVRKLCGSFDDARARAAEVVTQKRKGTYFDPQQSPALSEFAEKYLQQVSTLKSGFEREKQMMKLLVAEFGQKKLAKISRLNVVEYRKNRLKTVSPVTVNREIALLRHMFNVSIQWELCAKNPVLGLKQFDETRRDRFLSIEEVQRMRATLTRKIAESKGGSRWDWKTLEIVVLVAFHTGMRRGENLNMEWDHINWERRHIFIPKTKNKEPRRIPISSELFDNLLDHHRRVLDLFERHVQVAETKLSSAINANESKQRLAVLQANKEKAEKWLEGAERWVFPSYDRNANLVPLKDVKVGFGKLLRDAGIRGFRFHDLRHTFASHFMMNGGNLYTLAKLLGHKNIKMTMRYADLSQDYIDGERERLDKMWTPAAKPETSTVSSAVN